MRSFEVESVHRLWQLAFTKAPARCFAKRRVNEAPVLLGILDDRSRLACHLQWYLVEMAECLCLSLSQAIQKRGLPRSILMDDGSAKAFTQGRGASTLAGQGINVGTLRNPQ